MHITDITIGGILPFTDDVAIAFDERVNLFIGPNASGKSTVLKALSPDREADVRDKAYQPRIQWHVGGGWPVRPDGTINPYAVPRIYLPALRKGWPVENERDNLLYSPPNWTNLTAVLADFSDTFDAKSVFHAITILHERAQKEPSLNIQLARIAMTAYSCAKRICKEVFLGDAPSYYVDSIAPVEERSIDDLPEALLSAPVVRYANAVTIVDAPTTTTFIGELSSGTQGIYLWIWYLSFRIANFYNFREGWNNRPAVLMIDEIENHLHPTWQRRVIPALLDHFSGLQIFATTHSPFVVAGLKKGQVHLLNRDANGVVTATTNTEDIVGWTADEILRTMMGVEDPTDDATAAAARELRQLRNEGRPRANEREEEIRQARMQELRRLVDRDLLAGGPAAAQEELFEQQFAEALEKYLRVRDLSQENG